MIEDEKEPDNLLIPETAALAINRSEITIPNIFRNELENNFELVYDESDDFEESIDLYVYIGSKPISEEFKIFLLEQSNYFYGYMYQEESLGNLVESLPFFINDM